MVGGQCTIHPIVQRRKRRPERSSPSPRSWRNGDLWAETQALCICTHVTFTTTPQAAVTVAPFSGRGPGCAENLGNLPDRREGHWVSIPGCLAPVHTTNCLLPTPSLLARKEVGGFKLWLVCALSRCSQRGPSGMVGYGGDRWMGVWMAQL